MSNQVHHVASGAGASSPPPAPPLPPERQGFVANALARVAQPFGYGSRPATSTGHRATDPRSSRVSVQRSTRWASLPLLKSILKPPKVPQVPQESSETQTDVEPSPISSKSTSHKTGIPIAAVDISPDRTHAVLAGHNILKTIQVSAPACAEDVNLRAGVIAYTAAHEASGTANTLTHKHQWAINDVKWSHGQCSSTIATAAANGQIVVYDLYRPGLEIARLHEHNRQVHRLGFNPHKGQLLLSGSQDGTVRLWDLRDLSGDRSVLHCHSRCKFSGNSDGIRDLRWSPVDGVEFALGTDNGVIQRWDFRNDKNPLLRVNAHEHKTCFSIDWHPDGKHLASGGADKNIKVWDFSSSDRRKKNVWEIRAPQAVCNVRWRPACWSIGKQNSGKWQCTQLACSYDQEDPRIHVWDFHRPHVPFKVIDRYETPAAALLWRSENLLWSVGSAGMFTQTDINFVPKTMDRRSPHVLAMAPDGQILFFTQKEKRLQIPAEAMPEGTNQHNHRPSTKGSTEEAVRGSSDTPHHVQELNQSFLNRQRKSTGPTGTTRSNTATSPPAAPTGPVEDLSDSLRPKYKYEAESPQVGAVGYIAGLFDAPAFRFLARRLKVPPIPEGITRDTKINLHIVLADTLKYNAVTVAHTGQYRYSQSLNILAVAVKRELGIRAEKNYQSRMEAANAKSSHESVPKQSTGPDDNVKVNSTTSSINLDQLQAKDMNPSIIENTSNMTTPLARPVSDCMETGSVPSDMEQLSSATWSKQPVKPVEGVSALTKMASPKSADTESSRIDSNKAFSQPKYEEESSVQQKVQDVTQDIGLVDIDREMAERRAAMDNYRSIPRPLLRLDEPIEIRSSGPSDHKAHRHDSNESFQMFSASTDSSHHLQSGMGSLESTQNYQHSTKSTENLEAAESSKHVSAREPDETLPTFDDEAQLSPPTSSTIKEDKGGSSTTMGKISTDQRPEGIQHHIIHEEDMEEMFRQNEQLPKPAGNTAAEGSDKYIYADFFPPEQDPEDPFPISASKMLGQLAEFHAGKLYDAQLPTWLFLHLGKWFFHNVPYRRAMGIILQYHRQLTDLGCIVEAAELRKFGSRDLPELAEEGNYGITPGGPWCTNCKKPNKGDKAGFCERCEKRWAECPVCDGHGPLSPPDANGTCRKIEDSGGAALWTWCQECGHGGHMACLSNLWDMEESHGGCPTLGACVIVCLGSEEMKSMPSWRKSGKRRSQAL